MYFLCSAAACNIAVKMLSPKLNRLSLRFSRAIHMDIYNSTANVMSRFSSVEYLFAPCNFS